MRCTTPLSAGPSPPLCELNSIHGDDGGHGQGKRSFLGAAPPLPEPAPEPLPTVLRAPSQATRCRLLGLGGRRRRGRPLRRRQANGGQVREERHGGRAGLRPGVRPGGPVPRHAPPPGISHRHCRSDLPGPCSVLARQTWLEYGQAATRKEPRLILLSLMLK